MQAQVLHAPAPVAPGPDGPLVLEDVPLPKPGPGEVRLRVRACGVCRTDLHTVEGEIALPRLPLVPGHQVVGIVDKIGERVEAPTLGERVGAAWLARTCGECGACRRGRENLCERAEFTGLHIDGGYAEYMLADARYVFAVPEQLDDAHAAPLLCGGVIGWRAFKLSGAEEGDALGLWGFGNSAHVTIQLARHRGCRVFVFTRSEGHREHARALGAEWAGSADDSPPADIDAGIIFAPAGEIVPKALGVLAPGGTLALAGIHMSPIPEMPYELLYRERALRSVANSTREDARELLALAAEVPVTTDVTTRPLAEANAALLNLKESRTRGDIVLVP
ncbi:MAG: zinc-dependent alcohol dehydrogenase family protein [Planctomycetota bacterium]